jgi:hypothetical protein
MHGELETNPVAELKGAEPPAGLKADDAELIEKAKVLGLRIIKVERGSDEFWAKSARDFVAAVMVLEAMRDGDRRQFCGAIPPMASAG